MKFVMSSWSPSNDREQAWSSTPTTPVLKAEPDGAGPDGAGPDRAGQEQSRSVDPPTASGKYGAGEHSQQKWRSQRFGNLRPQRNQPGFSMKKMQGKKGQGGPIPWLRDLSDTSANCNHFGPGFKQTKKNIETTGENWMILWLWMKF